MRDPAGNVVIGVTIDADTLDEVVTLAAGQIRAAIHGAGGSTERWPTGDEWAAEIIGARQHIVDGRDGDLIDA